MENYAYTTLNNELLILNARRKVQEGKIHPDRLLKLDKQIQDLQDAILKIKNHGGENREKTEIRGENSK